MTDGFKAWLDFSQRVPEMPVGVIVNGGSGRDLTPGESPPTTPRSRTRATRKARASSRPWCR